MSSTLDLKSALMEMDKRIKHWKEKRDKAWREDRYDDYRAAVTWLSGFSDARLILMRNLPWDAPEREGVWE